VSQTVRTAGTDGEAEGRHAFSTPWQCCTHPEGPYCSEEQDTTQHHTPSPDCTPGDTSWVNAKHTTGRRRPGHNQLPLTRHSTPHPACTCVAVLSPRRDAAQRPWTTAACCVQHEQQLSNEAAQGSWKQGVSEAGTSSPGGIAAQAHPSCTGCRALDRSTVTTEPPIGSKQPNGEGAANRRMSTVLPECK
jgi:hypothetical protein